MATLGNAGRVGLVALVAAVLAVIGTNFLHGSLTAGRTYAFDVLFDDARGVTPETPVTLAGVQIGKVESVTLTPAQKADMKLRIQDKLNGKDIHIPRGSRFSIVTPLLGQSGTVVVLPPANAAQAATGSIGNNEPGLYGERTGDLTASFDKAAVLLDQVTQTTKKVDKLLDASTRLIGDPHIQGGLTQTVGNINAASANGLKLTNRLNGLLLADNAQVQALLRQTQTGAQASLGNIAATTASIRSTTEENRGQIRDIVRNLNDTTAAVAGITGQTNQALKTGGVTQNLEATVANLKTTTDTLNATMGKVSATMDKVNAMAGNFQSLTSDPKVQSNLRETVQNIRDSSEQTTLLLERLNKLAGTKPQKVAVVPIPGGPTVILPGGTNLPPVTPAPALGAPFYLPRVDLLVNTRARHFRTDIDAIVPLGVAPVTFARAGIYDITGSNKLILQAGQGVGKRGAADLRAGIYASKLSVGGDYGLGRSMTLSFDLYDPNNYHLDARGVIRLAPELGLVLGGEDLGRHPGGLIGLQYRMSR